MNRESHSKGYFVDPGGVKLGASATSLPLAGGLITLADLRRGRIDHALAMAIPQSRAAVWARPAQRTDGIDHSPGAIPEGTRFRLDPSLNIDAMHLPKFTAMLAHAAQRYGIYLRDKAGVVTFYAEDPVTASQNPWPAALQPNKQEILQQFPWDKLQVTKLSLRTWGNKKVP